MPNPTYTPAQLADEVQTLAENYRSTFVDFNNISDAIDYCNAGAEAYHSKVEGLEAEIEEDNGYFSDISTAVKSKTGQTEPYDKSEMADVISEEWVQPILITKQITENGTYSAEDDNADGYSEVVVNVQTPTPVIDNTGIDLLSLEEHKGYRQSNGSISGNGTDPNWSWFDPVNIGERKTVLYRLWGVYHSYVLNGMER